MFADQIIAELKRGLSLSCPLESLRVYFIQDLGALVLCHIENIYDEELKLFRWISNGNIHL